ncbi:Gfo/Idh/MocA family protein [Candidatus Laterigemmans baculatus]|uniref:Gfo/Idh/MocA family protein n=1 Tax=Candidatus Laterigemmans baculatus TaxID=2770505 RepID=UPI001F242144|nr:Gfo/Idh/MocA family oxidoreductase [Candidatus Laterigemmans baculatus]
MNRRTMLAALAAMPAACGGLSPSAAIRTALAAAANPRRVGVIGHTGRGNYGHGLDTLWLELPETKIVAVADADAAGLEAAKQRLRVEAGFADYRQMLQTARPEIVAVCPRHPDQHLEMTLAAIDAGARGIYIEKPFCRTPAEADEIRAACERSGAKLAVAHRNRYHPTLQAIDQLVAEGEIGRLLEIRGRGKGDRRGGSEDLWVLGSHVLNLIHYFAGTPRSCSAVVRRGGRAITQEDVRPGSEGLGPLAGDEVHARYETERGIVAYFDSIANDGTGGAGFGLQLIGSEGVIDVDCDRSPLAHLRRGNPFAVDSSATPWVPISSAGAGVPEPRRDLSALVNQHQGPARDLIEAIALDRPPRCDLEEGAMTVEMICAVFESHRQEGRSVSIPLAERSHPLLRL